MWFTPYFTEIYVSKGGPDQSAETSPEESRQFAIRAEILASIASHTTEFIYHINPLTMPFLLVLCDELQEWGRPTLQEMQNQRGSGFAEKVALEEPLFTGEDWHIKATLWYSIPLKNKPKEEDGTKQAEAEADALFALHKDFAQRKARTWFKRLRPAIDDEKRRIKFIWEMNLISKHPKAAQWVFEFDSAVEEKKDIKVDLFGPTKDWYRDKVIGDDEMSRADYNFFK